MCRLTAGDCAPSRIFELIRQGRTLDGSGRVQSACGAGSGGAGGIRTPDIRLAKAALSQLSYGPAESSG